MQPIQSRCRPTLRNARCASRWRERRDDERLTPHRSLLAAGLSDAFSVKPARAEPASAFLATPWADAARPDRTGAAHDAATQYLAKRIAKLSGAASRHSAHD